VTPEEFGDYLVYERLGGGGMATVHRAQRRHPSGEIDTSAPPVALKRLLPQLAQIEEFVVAFMDEAQLARQLRHDNIARTYDFGRIDSTYFIAMELVRGPTLAQIISACLEHGLEIPLPITMYVIVQLLDALDYAHHLSGANGKPLKIVHRDVTPSNIIVSTEGITKLIDFGIAKATNNNVRTKTGFIKGKFAYVAPEYIAGTIDMRADLFAAGIVAHEMLTGKKLFQVDNDMDTLKRVQSMVIEPPSKWNPKLASEIDAVVMAALQRDPSQRWTRARAMRNAFAHVAKQLPTPAQVATWVQEATGPAVRSDASAVSIEISLIEQTYVKKFGAGVLSSETARRSRVVWLVAALAVVLGGGAAAYLLTR
jgi:eukaryotic-like serine/threonine-protein kinase